MKRENRLLFEFFDQFSIGENMKKLIALASIVATLGLTIVMPASAEKTLSAEDLNVLISGKTADGYHNKKDFSFKNYFDPNGTLTRRTADGHVSTAKWRIDDNGEQCVQWEGSRKERCGPFVDNGDGSISKTRKGKKVITLKNFVDGNQLK
jgi:hypothetical protein